MVHTLDLGVPEAYRHEANVKCEEPDRERFGAEYDNELITVTCDCGEVFEEEYPEGTFSAAEEGDLEAEQMFLDRWERHVWEAIKKAGQYGEARENSLKATEPETDLCPGCGWSKFVGEDLCVQCRGELGDAAESDADRIASQMGALGALGREVEAVTGRVPEWDTLTIEQQRAQVAEHYADVVARSLATLRKSLESEPAAGESRTAMLRWFAQNVQDQGRMMAQRLDELGGQEL